MRFLRDRLNEYLNAGISSDGSELRDRVRARRIRMINGGGLAMLAGLPLALQHLIRTQEFGRAVIFVIAVGLSAISLHLMRRRGAVAIAMHTQLIVLSIILAWCGWMVGGPNGPGKAWPLVLPLYAGLVGGLSTAFIYTAVACSMWIGFLVLAKAGVKFTSIVPPEMYAAFDTMQTIVVCIVMLGIVGAFTRARREDEQTLLRANEELKRSRDLAEAATRAKSAFLANMSHEIRTPINGVMGMTTLLLDTPMTPTQRDYAETIRASSDSLLTVINDVLDFSRIEAGKLSIEPIEFDPLDCTESVASSLALQAATKGLELVVDIEPSVPTRVIGDAQRIRQCLTNFLANGIKFTAAGEVVIRVTREPNGSIRFCVRDTGIGIAEDVVPKLFQPFVQADGSTTRMFGGSGLGLSIVKKLVDLMGGTMGVTSTVGVGSQFWFELPLPAAQAAEASSSQGDRVRVLLVEPNRAQREAIERQLGFAGYEVHACSDAASAIRLIETSQPSFRIALVEQSDASADHLAAFAQVNGIVLIGMKRLEPRSAEASAHLLTKPIRRERLLACLRSVLEPQTQSDATAQGRTTACHSNSGTVLVVEDHPVNQKVARRFLERLGCNVVVADDGEQAIRAFSASRFDLVLMDIQMPGIDGYEAAQRIRRLETQEPRTPIVALTANAMSGQLERCIAAGMDDFLPKPVDIEHLRAALRAHIPAYASAEEQQRSA